MTRPLDGIRMLELAAFHNGPGAGYMLGDLGAEVIKIEDTVRGDTSRGTETLWGNTLSLPGGLNTQFETGNRNKKSITLDLKKEQGKEVLYRLVKESDVFYTNYSNRVLTKLGVDYDTLCRYNPKLVYGIATGYGTAGPEAGRRAFDIIAQAQSGMMTIGGEDATPPSQIVGGIVDQTGATMLAYGILAALLCRERTGIGQVVETSLLGTAMHMQAINVNICLLRGRPFSRVNRKRIRNPLANHYKCGDGKWLLLGELESDRFWSSFCDAIGIKDLENDSKFKTNQARRENFEELISILDKIFATKTREEWIQLLKEKGSGIAFSPVYDLSEAVRSPQVLENDYVTPFDHPVLGPIKLVGFPVKFGKTPASITRKPPEFGEHTEEILLEVGGYTWEEIAELKNQEVI